MNTATSKIPAPERPRLFQFRFFCRPKENHLNFYKLERMEFNVWIFDETDTAAAARACVFLSAFPITHSEKAIVTEITDEILNNGKLEPWRIDQCVKARELGIQFAVKKLTGDEESHQWPK